jgi:hypothetical protein
MITAKKRKTIIEGKRKAKEAIPDVNEEYKKTAL